MNAQSKRGMSHNFQKLLQTLATTISRKSFSGSYNIHEFRHYVRGFGHYFQGFCHDYLDLATISGKLFTLSGSEGPF